MNNLKTNQQPTIEKMKHEFLSMISHELRSPITSIYAALKLLGTEKLGNLSEQGHHLLNIAVNNTEHLNHLINDLLNLQMLTSGCIQMEPQMCNVQNLIEKVVTPMQAIATQAEITINVGLEHPIYCQADSDYIVQALTNLVSNAIKFSSPGQHIWISAREQSQNVLFEVKDQGKGIPSDQLESIFESFKQVNSSDSRPTGGTGNGLTICRHIVEQHGGKIWVESCLGQGTIFYFTLPASSYAGIISGSTRPCTFFNSHPL